MWITNKSDYLIVDSRPWVISLILGGVIFGLLAWSAVSLFQGDIITALMPLPIVVFMALFVWAFVRRNQLILHAANQTVTHRRRTLLRYSTVTYDLAHLSHADVADSHMSDGAPTHRMMFHITDGMDAGAHPFTVAYTSGYGAKHGANAVNRWLAARRS